MPSPTLRRSPLSERSNPRTSTNYNSSNLSGSSVFISDVFGSALPVLSESDVIGVAGNKEQKKKENQVDELGINTENNENSLQSCLGNKEMNLHEYSNDLQDKTQSVDNNVCSFLLSSKCKLSEGTLSKEQEMCNGLYQCNTTNKPFSLKNIIQHPIDTQENILYYDSIEEFVKLNDGNSVIVRILIANNGNAAIKAITSLRQWGFATFQNDRVLEFVVMATPDDIEGNAEYISEGDFLVEVPEGRTENNYANIHLIVQIAEEYGCDAVWPGWGHSSENYKLPLALAKSVKHPIWIGPSPSSMMLLGDKIASTIIAQSVGVPCVEWSGSHVQWDSSLFYSDEGEILLKECISKACVHSLEHILRVCNNTGFPIMIKASSGGGGKGIRKIYCKDDIESAFRQVTSEVKGSTVFVMKLLESCRHVEIQIMGDMYGCIRALGNRDCTVQRRCQKLIEEGPIVTAPKHIIKAMEDAAIKLCTAVNYTNAATCEFLYDVQNETFYFLEVNTRLQVEHVVTEVNHDLNLPAAQLQISMGIPLFRIIDIHRSLCLPFIQSSTHCISARITAEHAEDCFKPTCGRVLELQLRSSMHVWGYFSLGTTGKVHPYADSQIGHVFSMGRNREDARCHLITALRRLTIRGEIRTNVEALLKILQLPDFIHNHTHTTWVETCVNFNTEEPCLSLPIHHFNPFSITSQDSHRVSKEHDQTMVIGHRTSLAVLLAAAYEACLKFKQSEEAFLEKIGQGQLPPPITVYHGSELVYKGFSFNVKCFHMGQFRILVYLNNSSSEVFLRPISSTLSSQSTNHCSTDDCVSAACFLVSGGPDGKSRTVFYRVDATGICVTFDGSTFTFTKETDPTQVRAPVSGKLSRWLVPNGTLVQRGQTYAEIEIMKMYMQLQVADSGHISHALAEGAVFQTGDLLATMELPEGITAEKAIEYMGGFPSSNARLYRGMAKSSNSSTAIINPLREIREARDCLYCVLNGYYCTSLDLKNALDIYVNGLFNPLIPGLEVLEVLSVMEAQLPDNLLKQLYKVLKLTPPSYDISFEKLKNGDIHSTRFNRFKEYYGTFNSTEESDGSHLFQCQIINGKKHQGNLLCSSTPCDTLETDRPNHRLLFASSGDSCISQIFDLLEDCRLNHTNESEELSHLQLTPLMDILRKHENGMLTTAVDTFISLLNHYLDIEEMFHQYDREAASKVLLLKRTEFDASRLAVVARSHQSLSQRNELINELLRCIRNNIYLMEAIPLFNNVLQRLSNLTKPEYASVSLRARQLLLTRRQRPFLQRTLSLIDNFSDYLERRQPLEISGSGSQLLFGHSYSPTTTTLKHFTLAGAPVTPASSGTVVGTTLSSCGFSSSGNACIGYSGMDTGISSLIQTFVGDLEEVSDDSLIALFAHPKGELRKMALEVYIRRHFEKSGLHNLRICCDGDIWIQPFSLSTKDERRGSNDISQNSLQYLNQNAIPTRLILSTKRYSKHSGLTPSRWGNSYITGENEHWTGVQMKSMTDQFGTPTWRLPLHGLSTVSTPNSQRGNRYDQLCYDPFLVNTVISTGMNQTTTMSTNSNKLVNNDTTVPPLILFSNEKNVNEVCGVQTVNKLLAVWICSAVLSYEFLTQICDVITNGGTDIIQSSSKTESECVDTGSLKQLNSASSTMPPEYQHAMSLLVQHSNNKACDDILTFQQLKQQSTSRSGLDSDSRLHHMLNAFGSHGADLNESPNGRSQMIVAMAFGTLNEFRNQFEACLDEYTQLQTFLPSSPPAIDGKVLLIFISDIKDDAKPKGTTQQALNEHTPSNCGITFQIECEKHEVQLTELGFHLVGFSFLCGQHLKELKFDSTVPKKSKEIEPRQKETRLSCFVVGQTEVTHHFDMLEKESSSFSSSSSSLSEKPQVPKLDKISSINQQNQAHVLSSTINTEYQATQESNEFDTYQNPLCDIKYNLFKASDNKNNTQNTPLEQNDTVQHNELLKIHQLSNNHSLPSSIPIPTQQSDLFYHHDIADNLNPISSSDQPTNTSHLSFRLSPEEVFSDFDLVCSSVPRYFYFRNRSALPPFIPDENSTSKFREEPLLRNVVMSQFGQLELKRLIHFNVKVEPTSIPHIHLFEATPKPSTMITSNIESTGIITKKEDTLNLSRSNDSSRFFVRILLYYKLNNNDEDWAELERHFVAGLNALEIALKSKNVIGGRRPAQSHHILMTVLLQAGTTIDTQQTHSGPECFTGLTQCHNGRRMSPSTAETAALILAKQYEQRLLDNKVGTIEIRFAQRSLQVSDTFVPIRIVVTNPTRQSFRVQKFVEITDPTTGELVYSALDASDSLAISVRQSDNHFNYCDLSKPSLSGLSIESIPRPSSSRSTFNSNMRTPTLKDSVYDGLPVNTPHPLTGLLEEKRAMAASLSTIYIYDFLELFEEAIKKQWRSCPKYFVPVFPGERDTLLYTDIPSTGTHFDSSINHSTVFLPDKVLESVELTLDHRAEVTETRRDPGQNECGMVCWRILMRTPEFPRGRRIILIGNDVTFHMGTFGVQEDLLFQRVSEVARKEGIPRIYIAVNSGARMGLATEVQRVLKVKWVNTFNPSKGFKYLYVTEDDYRQLRNTESITAEPIVQSSGECVYRLTSILGSQIGLGVENLCGSGAIAGETSRAYKSNVTITFVTGRTVGIGAYITRLGQRVIQKASGAPILLTGYQALNRLIGRDVYGSNDEIGGVDVMARNGVTHIVVADDIQGCEEIIRWLSYIPEHTEGALPIMVDPSDPITRPVLYRIASFTEDPRLMLTGCIDAKGRWLGGIFDKGSFREVLADWAKSLIVGRARLGGIPVGVITVETRVTETIVPADPAMSESTETKLLRAGQVWFPDSAYKTAQAISDFNQEEIPLMIFANWRGFSGGQRDMFHEVLKFGSFIVDALVDFKQPCFVYIPPKAELRGGAWVVVDPRINSNYIEMFADPDSRGGVLEPTGIVEIKFRREALCELAERLDYSLQEMKHEDHRLATEGVALDDSRRVAIKDKRDKRLQDLIPIYKQVAVHFADLHDTATRMKRRSAISEIVPWERCRDFFYWRLRRQLILFNLRVEIVKANPTLSITFAEQLIYKWAEESGHAFQGIRSNSLTATSTLNAQFVHWACHSLADISRRLAGLRKQYQKEQVLSICKKTPEFIIDAIKEVAPNTDPVLLSALFEKL